MTSTMSYNEHHRRSVLKRKSGWALLPDRVYAERFKYQIVSHKSFRSRSLSRFFWAAVCVHYVEICHINYGYPCLNLKPLL